MADGHFPNAQTEGAAWTDLGGGWARDERGVLIRTVTEIEDVIAEHCLGGARITEPFTRLTSRKLLKDGGAFIANLDGHLPQDHVVKFSHHTKAYRLTFPVVAQRVAA